MEKNYRVRPEGEARNGGIIGTVDIVDCVQDHPSKWAIGGQWHFVLANPRRLPFVPWKGALSITDAKPELLKLLKL